MSPGETLSKFAEDSLHRNVEFRTTHNEFIERGLASRDAAQMTGKYISAEKVLHKLSTKLEKVRRKESDI